MPRLLPCPVHHVVIFFFFCALLIPAGRSRSLQVYCPFTANYTRNSTFQSNLHAVLSALSSRAPLTGFSRHTSGAGPDRVYGLALCRRDVSPDSCHSCLENVVDDVTFRCGSAKTAAVWYDECLLRYSERNFLSSVDNSYAFDIPNPNKVSEPQQFGRSLSALLDELVAAAAYRRPGHMFAVQKTSDNGSGSLYGLVQCTGDLSSDQCSDCLSVLRKRLPTCCGRKEGGRLFGLNCVLRFETFPFFLASEAAPAPPPSTRGPEKKVSGGVIAAMFLSALFASSVAISCYVRVMKWRKAKANASKTRKTITLGNIFDGAEDDKIGYDESLSFDLITLRTATNNFSDENKLGEGGFGRVYKGVLPSGQHIAIKKLTRSSRQGLVGLRNEMVLVAKLQHRNLVRLLGYCLEEDANLLVYEYLPNKSLDKFLFDPTKRMQLNWEKRYKIIEGIARGLLYLHEDSRLKIIHRDLKAANILLDREMNPKISDFGLAKLCGIEQSQGNTSRVVGTYGYMAPEYVNGHYSKKSDIYSFGIIVLEIITGRQSIGFQNSGDAVTLSSYVWQHWVGETLMDVLDQSMVRGCSMEQVSRCAQIGFLCLQEDPNQRPTTASVVLMLSSDVIRLPTVSEPAFCRLGGTTTGFVSSITDLGIHSSGNECCSSEIQIVTD